MWFAVIGILLLQYAQENVCKRIIHGRQAFIEEFPYQVSIEVASKHACGGSLISKSIVITAAHCTAHVDQRQMLFDPKTLRVRAGASFANSDGSVHNVTLVQKHPEHNSDPVHADIALLLLDEPIQMSDRVKPILLSEKTPKPGQISWVTGYGMTNIQTRQGPMTGDAEAMSRELRVVRLPIVLQEECRRTLRERGAIVTSGMICAGYKKGHRDACKGDSGGPLVIDSRLVGLTAWGLGCGVEGMPGVYTDIAYHLPWINSAITSLRNFDQMHRYYHSLAHQ